MTLLKEFLLTKFPGILSLHELHTWTFTPGTLVMTGHITYQVPVLPLSISSDMDVQDVEVYNKISGEVETFLYSQGFSHVTIQPEFPSPDREDCNLKCEVRSAELDQS